MVHVYLQEPGTHHSCSPSAYWDLRVAQAHFRFGHVHPLSRVGAKAHLILASVDQIIACLTGYSAPAN